MAKSKGLLVALSTLVALAGANELFSQQKTTTVNAAETININGGVATNFRGKFNNGGVNENVVYFEMAENDAPFKGDSSLRYKPLSSDAITLNRGGTIYNIANTGAETIAKTSATDYFITDWMCGSYKPYQTGDIITINGTFIYGNYNLVISESSYEVNSEGVVVPKVAVEINSTKEISVSSNGIDMTVEDDEVPYNSDATVRFTPLNTTDALTLERNGTVYQLAKAWSILAKTKINKYYIDFNFQFNTDVIDFKGFENGDIIKVNGLFYNTINGVEYNITINITYEFTITEVVGGVGKDFSIGNKSYLDNGDCFGFTLPENDLPVFNETENKYLNVESTYGVLLLRDGVLKETAHTLGDTIQKANETKYYLKYWSWGASLPLRPDDVIIFGDYFTLNQGGKSYRFKLGTSSLKLGQEKNEVYDCSFEDELLNALAVDTEIYAENDIDLIESLLAQFSVSLKACKSNQEILSLYNNTKSSIDAIVPNEELLAQKLVLAKDEYIKNVYKFVNFENYFDEQKVIVSNFVDTYVSNIQNSTSISEIHSLFSEFKNKVNNTATKSVIMENAIMSQETNFEQYLEDYDVVSLHDLFLGDSVVFNSQIPSVSNNNIYYENGKNLNTDTILATEVNTFANSATNPNGNVVFRFKYKATSHVTNNSSHLIIKLRGENSYGYIFQVGYANAGYLVNSTASQYEDSFVGGKGDIFNSNQEYLIELGAIDLVGIDKTWIFVKVDGIMRTSSIVKSISFCKNASVTMRGNPSPKVGNGIATISNVDTPEANKGEIVGYPVEVNEQAISSGVVVGISDNSISANTDLYPLDSDAVKLNNIVISNNSKTILRKQNGNSYLIKLAENDVSSYSGGDLLTIKGRFATFDSNNYRKNVINVSETSFTYDAALNVWKRVELSLDELKDEANIEINRIANISLYDDSDKPIINSLILDAKVTVLAASNKEEINSSLTELRSMLSQVKTTLEKEVATKTSSLNEYLCGSLDSYYQDQKDEISSIKSQTIQNFALATSKQAVNSLYDEAISKLNNVKTKVEVDLAKLNNAKKVAKTNIESLYNKVNVSTLSSSSLVELNQKVLKAIDDVDSSNNVEAINQVFNQFESYISPLLPKENKEENDNLVWIIIGSSCGGAIILGGAITALILILKKKKGAKVK